MKAKVVRAPSTQLIQGEVYEVRISNEYGDRYYDALVNGRWTIGWHKSRFILVDAPSITLACECLKCAGPK